MFSDINQRAREIMRHVVDAYMATGEPVGSKAIAERLGMSLSSATIRAVMADLEAHGLLLAPHVSAGRIPTEAGLRFFVDGILEIGDLAAEEKNSIEAKFLSEGKSLKDMITKASDVLSGLTSCAGLVLAPKTDGALRRIEFVNLGGGKILLVLVFADGSVENRVMDAPAGMDAGDLVAASNYINFKVARKRLSDARKDIEAEIRDRRAELDGLAGKLVQAGLAVWSGQKIGGQLLIRGQAKLLEDVSAMEDLERIRQLFEILETDDAVKCLLEAASDAEGVRIFIGAENNLFANTGCSVVVAPYRNAEEQVIGAIGVIGPLRMNYARIIPVVDYTSKLLGGLAG